MSQRAVPTLPNTCSTWPIYNAPYSTLFVRHRHMVRRRRIILNGLRHKFVNMHGENLKHLPSRWPMFSKLYKSSPNCKSLVRTPVIPTKRNSARVRNDP